MEWEGKLLDFKTGRKYERNIEIGMLKFLRVTPKILNSFIDYLLNLSKNSLISCFDSNILNLFDKHFYSIFR